MKWFMCITGDFFVWTTGSKYCEQYYKGMQFYVMRLNWYNISILK